MGDLTLLVLSLTLLGISHLCAVVVGINIELGHTPDGRIMLALAIIFALIGMAGLLIAGVGIGGAA